MNELEKEYTDLFDARLKEINDKLSESDKLLEEAIKLSEKYGVPFSHDSGANNCYVPKSFSKIQKNQSDECKEALEELFDKHGIYGNDYDSSLFCGGWQRSYC